MNDEKSIFDMIMEIPKDIRDYGIIFWKIPRFIKKLYINNILKKYYKFIDKFRESNIVLNKLLLDQYLYIIENSYNGYGVIKSTKSVYMDSRLYKPYKYMRAKLDLGDFKAIIKSADNEKTFELELHYTKKIQGSVEVENCTYTFVGNRLFSPMEEYREYIRTVNQKLLKDICDYFKEYLKYSCDINVLLSIEKEIRNEE